MEQEFKFPIVAFGSNTNLKDLNDYALTNGYPADCIQFSSIVSAPDHKLAFTKYSGNRSGGVLDLIGSIGHLTTVALFYANDAGLELLRQKEGVPRHYIEKEITVIDEVGNEIQARTYVVTPEKREKFVRPSDEYLRICKEGFEQLGIGTYELMAAAENKEVEPLPGFFCYGTLMRDEPRFPVIARHGLSCALTAFCFGSLTTNGAFPALNLEGNGFSRGDYFVSKDIASLLSVTDQIEGFQGFGSKNNLFRRTCVPVDVGGNGQRPAWVYVRNEEFDTKVQDNDWRSFLGKRKSFSEALLAAHEVYGLNFYDELTWNYARFSNIETLDREKVISLLNDEMSLTERTMAQVSENWVALTNESLGGTYA